LICALLAARGEADPDDAVLADAQAPVLAALGDDGRGQRRRRGEEREARDAGACSQLEHALAAQRVLLRRLGEDVPLVVPAAQLLESARGRVGELKG